MGGYGLAGLTAEWRQQSWGHHHHHQQAVTATPSTATGPTHYQWTGLQGSYAHPGHHSAGLYQGYQQCGVGLANSSSASATSHSAQRSPPEVPTSMASYADTSITQGYTTARSSPSYESIHTAGVYGGGRLHEESPDHNSTGGGSPQSGGSPPMSHTTTQADMFILPDLVYPSGLTSSHSDVSRIKDEGLTDAYSATAAHAWSPLSPACM